VAALFFLKALEQVRMGSGTGKKDLFIRQTVNQEQITLYMTFGISAVVAGKIMLPVLCWQRLFPNNHSHNIQNFINVFTSPLHKVEVLYEFVGKYRGKHGTALQDFFQGGFQFFAGLVLPGVYEYGAGDFPPQYGLALLEGGQGYGIGGMSGGVFWGNFSVFYDVYGVHTRLLTLNYTPFWEERQLFRLFLPGAAPPGDLPNRFKGFFGVNSLLGQGLYTGFI
jgi:hypothetical protein